MCVQKGTASKIKRKITLEEFSEGFFDDYSMYIKNKIRFGKESGKESIINHKRNLEKYILPKVIINIPTKDIIIAFHGITIPRFITSPRVLFIRTLVGIVDSK